MTDAFEPKQFGAIAVDFDGTLCENRFPEIGEPKPLVIAFVRQQVAKGARIILHTCRENGARRALLDEAVAWCAAREIPIHAVNENPDSAFPELYGTGAAGRKVYADLYIDDKAISAADIEQCMKDAAIIARHGDDNGISAADIKQCMEVAASICRRGPARDCRDPPA
ncbi:MAG: hypothetical protein LBL83_11405 [Clostridiales bacterium]|jgi:hypothetical protein|nr:hypothetical protein [Clostridiales bacterium]